MKINFIWQKRFFDNTALLNTKVVTKGTNYIAFSADPKMTHYYSIDSEAIKKCPIQKNGHGSVYVIPFNSLKDEGLIPQEYLNLKYASQQEYLNWKNSLKSNKK